MAISFASSMFEQQDFLARQIRDAKAGDVAAFERIVNAHQRTVLRLAQNILSNREAAKDAAQEVFIRLHKNLRSLDETRDLSGWLYRTTANLCYDMLRRNRQEVPVDLAAEPADRRPNPEESFRAAQQKRLVASALETLSARERQVIALRDLEGRPVSEVAGILKIAEGTVRSQLSTGRIKIKDFITAQLERRI